MDYCRKGELKGNSNIVDAILKSSDYIKQLCNDVEAYRDQGLMDNIESLVSRIEALSAVEDNMFKPEEQQVQEQPQENVEVEKQTEQSQDNSDTQTQQEQAQENSQDCSENQNNVEQEGQNVECQNIEQTSDSEQNEENQNPTTAQGEKGLELFAQEISEFENVESHIEKDSEPQNGERQEDSNELQPQDEFNQGDSMVPQKSEEQQSNAVCPVEQVENQGLEKVERAEESTVILTDFQKNVLEKLSTETVEETIQKDASTSKLHSTNEEYMKVANYKIDHLVDMMGELIINQSLREQYVSAKYNDDKQLVTNMSGFLRITRELQNLSMSLRMVALKPTFQKLMRIARDTIKELDKNIEFDVSGENTEIDRAVAEKLLDPLVHMVKNAISHGIETNEQDRTVQGEPAIAKVEVSAYSKRGKIFIEVKDDGRGIDTEAVYQKAMEKGLIIPGKAYSDAEIIEFIMLPGFSTAKVVDNISGRGVGMDVVKTQIIKAGGKVEIQSEKGKGSTFTLEVPVNHAIMNGTIIEMNKQQFVVPTVNVKEFLQPTDNEWIFTKQERTMIKVRENIIPIVPQSTFFSEVKEPDHVPLVMILELDQVLRAVPIDNVINRQEVVVKPVGAEFSHLKYISGMSILGTGKVSLILDIDYLFKKEVQE